MSLWFLKDICNISIIHDIDRIARINPDLAYFDHFYALQYADFVLRDKFPLGEHAIAKDAFYSYNYAKYVCKGLFSLGELTISTDPHYSYMYAKHVLNGRFQLGEKEIAKEVNLSPSPVFERVKRLEQEGYIKKYAAILDAEKLKMIFHFEPEEKVNEFSKISTELQIKLKLEDDKILLLKNNKKCVLTVDIFYYVLNEKMTRDEAYKTAKEAFIKEQANKWKSQIDDRAYEALMNYTVETTD